MITPGIQMRYHPSLLTRTAMALAFLAPLLAGPVAADDSRVREDYRVTEGRLAGGLRPCLEQAQGDFEGALVCSQLVFEECVSAGPSGDTTAGLTICSSVSAEILDAEMNAIWADIKATAPASDFT